MKYLHLAINESGDEQARKVLAVLCQIANLTTPAESEPYVYRAWVEDIGNGMHPRSA